MEDERVRAKTVGAMLPGDHLWLAYDNAEERRAILAAFVRDALRDGHVLLYVVDGEPAAAAAERLRAEYGGTGAALDDGRITVVADQPAGTLADTLTERVSGAIEEALRRGHPGVRVTAEASPSPRCWPGTDRFAAFEGALHRAVAVPGSRVAALCQYDRRWFTAAHLHALDERHGGRVRADDVFDDGVLRITPLFAPPGLRLSGAIDESTLPALVAALRGVDDRVSHLCLDLSRLDFCDLDGLRALIEAGRTGAAPDRQVILRSMPGCVELMLRVSGWDRAPGVVREGVR